tara:strand:+ start:1178 stop:1768 length:591 start_codon:yes stop_codon:yes gene_type:complete
MKKQFTNLILIPCIFFITLLAVLLFKFSPISFLLFLVFISEHLYKWSLSVNTKYDDFRIFYTDQYFKLLYLGILFLIYILNTISWQYSGLWFIFAYAGNFIIFRILGSTGTDQLTQTLGSVSKPVSSNFDLWEENKILLSNLIENLDDLELKNFIESNLNYSSFLRTTKASNLIKEAIEASEEDSLKVILKIKELI